jgi:hypothetical protein
LDAVAAGSEAGVGAGGAASDSAQKEAHGSLYDEFDPNADDLLGLSDQSDEE